MLNGSNTGNRNSAFDFAPLGVEDCYLLISLGVYDESELAAIGRPRSGRADEAQRIELRRCTCVSELLDRPTSSSVGEKEIETEKPACSEERDVPSIRADYR